jgi:hypothetical protein
MSAVKRRMIMTLAAASLALCAVMMTLLVRSYWRSDAITHRTAAASFDLWTERGSLTFQRMSSPLTEWEAVGWGWSSTPTAPPSPAWPDPGVRIGVHAAGFELYVSDGGTVSLGTNNMYGSTPVVAGSPPRVRVAVPLWLGAVIFALPAIVVTVRRARCRRRRALHNCANCGYDLRATPGRCPECGSVVAATA